MKAVREFAGVFVLVALATRFWPEFWGVRVEHDGPLGMPDLRQVFGVAVALCFAAHLMPARIGAERQADRQGQFGPRSPLLAGVGVLAGASIAGGWGGPVGLGLALAAMAWSGRGLADGADAD